MGDGDVVIRQIKAILIEDTVGWEDTKLVRKLRDLCASYGYPVPRMPRSPKVK